MIYNTKSKAYQRFVRPKKCAVCYKDFCQDCQECLESRVNLPCPCEDGVCNRCYVGSAVATMVPCSRENCQCGKAMWKCPLARHEIQLGAPEVDWINGTNAHHNIVTPPTD